MGADGVPVGCCIQASVATIRNPDAHEPRNTRKAVNQCAFGPSRFSPNRKRAQKTRFQEEGEDAFHGQRLADHAAGGFGEARPVSAELKLHRDAGHHAHGEIDGEDLGPEPGGARVVRVAGAERHALQNQNQQSQPHGQLGKQVVKGDGECEVQTVNG